MVRLGVSGQAAYVASGAARTRRYGETCRLARERDRWARGRSQVLARLGERSADEGAGCAHDRIGGALCCRTVPRGRVNARGEKKMKIREKVAEYDCRLMRRKADEERPLC